MWLLFWPQLLCIGVAAESMIQLRDKDFDDDDRQLTRILRERMKGRAIDPMDIPLTSDPELKKYFEDTTGYTLKMMEMEGVNVTDEDMDPNFLTRRQANKPVRQQLDKNITEDVQKQGKDIMVVGLVVPMESGRRQKSWRFRKEPEERDIKERNMEMMQQQIYATQYRMRDLQRIIDKYSGDLRYKVAYIYCRLETLLYEMHVTHSYMNRTATTNNAHIHMIYYTYFMKKNIDVTYIVEYMIRIHTDYMNSISQTRSPFQGINATAKPPAAGPSGNDTGASPGGGEAGDGAPAPAPGEEAAPPARDASSPPPPDTTK